MPARRTGYDRAAVACAALVALAVALAAMSPAPVGVFWDDGVYVISAKALATGHGYRYINLPGAPAATHFPPLWPALLSLVWRVSPDFPENVRWMKVVNPLLLSLGAAGTAVLAIRIARVPAWVAAILGAATVALAPMLMLSAVLMSEPLSLALTAPAIAAATLMVVRGRTRDGVVAGILVGLAVLARSAAIVLLPSLMIGLWWTRSRRASSVALAVALALCVPWFAWSAAHAHELGPALVASYGPYTGWAFDGYRAEPALLAEVIARNASTMLREAGIVIFGAFPRVTREPLLVLLIAMSLVGLRGATRRMAPLVIALAGYTVLVLAWPYAPGRFVWAYLPLYAVLAAASATSLVRRARHARAWRVPAVAAVTITVTALVSLVRYDVVGFARGWHATAIESIAGPLAESVGAVSRITAPGDTIATDVNLTTYLYTGRIALPISTLTVAEYLRPKTPQQIRAEFALIDGAFRPQWWIATGLVPERGDFAAWIRDGNSGLRPAATLPNGGLAARRGGG